MTKIANIKQVMQSDREKVNIVYIYDLELNTSRTDTRSCCIYEVEPNTCRASISTRNCGRTSDRKKKNTYGTSAAEALDLGSTSSPAMSLLR